MLAAVLAGVLRGLEREEEPGPASPATPTTRQASLPLTWEEAIAAFRAGERLPPYFGERFCRLFAACREAERNRFHARITPTEYEWYLTTV